MSQTLQIIPIRAFKDNYIWLIHDGQDAIAVDPGDASPVLETLDQNGLALQSILITHHHHDHIGGVVALQKTYPQVTVYAPQLESYTFAHEPTAEPDVIQINLGKQTLRFSVLDVPGHTNGHIAYYLAQAQSIFCGDTLFGAGCGRLFEGTPSEMLTSLKKITDLPKPTLVYCTHEYTEHNLNFALSLEPESLQLKARLADTMTKLSAGQPSLPSSIALELSTNPFLRCNQMALKQAIGFINADELTTFTEIRKRRNIY